MMLLGINPQNAWSGKRFQIVSYFKTHLWLRLWQMCVLCQHQNNLGVCGTLLKVNCDGLTKSQLGSWREAGREREDRIVPWAS